MLNVKMLVFYKSNIKMYKVQKVQLYTLNVSAKYFQNSFFR